MAKNLNVSSRLREFVESHFQSVNDFAHAMGISQSAASQLLTGNRVPGNKTQQKLRALGCEIEWLMTGEKGEERGERNPVKEDEAMLRKLKSMGIDNLDKLEKFLSPSDIAQDVALILRERMQRYGKKRR